MAIKVNGTTVIDDSRNLSNVGGLKTVNGTSLVGSGNISAGASTTYNAVGTYCFASRQTINITDGSTYAGSTLRPGGAVRFSNDSADGYGAWYGTRGGSYLSGTWRAMGRMKNTTGGSTDTSWTLFVRIS